MDKAMFYHKLGVRWTRTGQSSGRKEKRPVPIHFLWQSGVRLLQRFDFKVKNKSLYFRTLTGFRTVFKWEPLFKKSSEKQFVGKLLPFFSWMAQPLHIKLKNRIPVQAPSGEKLGFFSYASNTTKPAFNTREPAHS